MRLGRTEIAFTLGVAMLELNAWRDFLSFVHDNDNPNFTSAAEDLDRNVVAKDQIRTIVRTFKERLFTEIF